MDRLRVKAEEAIGNEDPEGAAMNMGRAALMAHVLAKTHHEDGSAVRLFQGAEQLFRSQEHSYRAWPSFAGPEANSRLHRESVEVSLSHRTAVQQSLATLKSEIPAPSPLATKALQLRDAATDWETVVDSMIADYQCR